jgi:hypothetical protein
MLVFWPLCVWTKSLICKDAANRDSTVQREVRRNSSSLSAVRTPTVPAPSVRMTCSFCPDTCIVSSSFCASLLRPDVSAARPDAYQLSNGSLILSKFKKWKINQPSGRCGIPSGHLTAVVRMLVHRIW